MGREIPERLKALRQVMSSRGVAAVIVPSTDPHQSEYVSGHWQARQWLSGFSGSSGTVVVTLGQAGLWTDGRYFIQARRELRGSGIALFKTREPGVPGVNEWIASQLKPGQVVAFDSRLFTMDSVRAMEKDFSGKRLKLRGREDLVGLIWGNRPPPPCAPAWDFPVTFAGVSRARKLAEVRSRLREKKADGLLLSSLDDIAWLFNIRGGDLPHCPVVRAFALIEGRRAALFADPVKFTPALKQDLRKAGVRLCPYDSIIARLKSWSPRKPLCLNPRRISQWLADALPASGKVIEACPDITTELKAVKNEVEQANVRRAALLDGLALVRFLAWLERSLTTGQRITESEAADRLMDFRKEAPAYRGDSFSAICAFGANGAMVHYSAKEGTSAVLRRSGLLLVDSGGNYCEGTMDTTRTVALGPVSLEARRSYTLVLKGLMALSRARFPAGTTGTHLDVLARAPLWAQGMNYRHGSGHGIGSYLNVHEGPQSLSPVWNEHEFKPGMIVTIEPGHYVKDRYGIRTENMGLVVPAETTRDGAFFKFETLTVCPIDLSPLMPDLLSPEEKAWLNGYHRTVRRRLAPFLDRLDRDWLRRKTEPIS